MSKIKWGAIVVDGRGKLGGHVFTKTKSGATMRTKVTPVNPQTAAQAAARSRLGGNSQQWGSLTELQRESWQNRAKETSKTNIFGDQYFPSGKNLFTSLNNNLLLVGSQPIAVAPALGQMPFIVNIGLEIVAQPASITIDLEYSGTADDHYLVYEATNGFSQGKYNFDGSYRNIAFVPANDLLNSTGLVNAYRYKFGAIVAGTKISFRCYFVHGITGQASPRFSVNAIVR